MTKGQKDLEHLAAVAKRYGLTVWQWKGHGPVGQHSPNSLHFLTFANGEGRAFDAYGPSYRMAAYAWHLRVFYKARLTEGIYHGQPGRSLSVKNGGNVSSSYWGAQTWDAHTNHVHIGI